MRIAHVVWGMETGGIETMLVNIINEQVKTQTVSLFVINDFIDKEIMSKISPLCKVAFINRKPGSRNPIFIIKLNYHLQQFSPNIIHVHSAGVSKLIIGRRKIVRTIHNTRNLPDEYPKMSALYAISHAVKEDVCKLGFNNVTVVPNGIRVSEFKKKEKYSKHGSRFHIIQVGRLFIKQKGQNCLINALEILVKQRGYKDLSVHFVGDGPDSEYLHNIVKEKDLEAFVGFEGVKTQEYLQTHLCDYDLFVQPSNYEGFGLTVAEAMAAKLPVIVSDIEGPMEIIDNGLYGMSYRCGDVVDLADKIESVLTNGYEDSMIDMAYDRVNKKYNVEQTAKKYLEEYEKILNK